jgi:hypothetical protein
MLLFDLGMILAAFVHGTPDTGKNDLIDGINAGMTIEGFGNKIAFIIRAIALAGEIKTAIANSFKYGGPFGGFKRNAIGACKAGGDKSDASRGCHVLLLIRLDIPPNRV